MNASKLFSAMGSAGEAYDAPSDPRSAGEGDAPSILEWDAPSIPLPSTPSLSAPLFIVPQYIFLTACYVPRVKKFWLRRHWTR